MAEQETNRPNLANEKLDYLNSISPIAQQLQTEPTPSAPTLSKKHKIVLTILASIAVALIIVIVLVDRDSGSIVNYVSPNDYSSNYGAIPIEIIDDYKINIETPDFSSAIAVSDMNANALNFYLDQPDTIVAIFEPSGISALDRKSDTVYIYASIPLESDYVGFFPSDFNADGSSKDDWLLPEQTAIYFSQSELFSQLTSSASFYLISKE